VTDDDIDTLSAFIIKALDRRSNTLCWQIPGTMQIEQSRLVEVHWRLLWITRAMSTGFNVGPNIKTTPVMEKYYRHRTIFKMLRMLESKVISHLKK